jgi:hypothetical protein
MSASPVAQVRSFNRAVTERVGALETGYLGRGRPLGEARLLWEIGHSGADVRELRQRLGLDSGYASRLLRSLASPTSWRRPCSSRSTRLSAPGW